ncbi:MAG: hypothetical protein JW984_14630 [Deltaproteobacteria bacterium]|uniref:Lipocalin-like domain-containing protein n=1 Tax=Candidatus Zymogenus saltonus TaxID=2844893 RepID=A0A9D8KGQ0_9DELT|nr:hypothetical protein [Candidatus Zymogenus saltonus]
MKTFLRAAVVTMLVLLAGILLARDASAKVIIDYVDETHSKYFTVHGPNKINFEFPFHTVNFWVKVQEPNGSVVDFDLNKGEIINLNAHGMHTITVYSKGGVGLFYAAYHTTETGYEHGSNRKPMCYTPRSDVRTNKGTAYGYLKSGHNCKWMIVDNTGEVRLDFSWAENSPVSTSPVKFRVKIETEGGYATGLIRPNSVPGHTNIKTLGDWELNRNTIPFLLQGGGVFYVTIYCTSGRGDWSSVFYPTGKKPGTVKPSGEDHHHHHGSNSIVGKWAMTNKVTTVGGRTCSWTFNADGTFFHHCQVLSHDGSWQNLYYQGTYKVTGNTAEIQFKTRWFTPPDKDWVPYNNRYSFNFEFLDGNRMKISTYGYVYTRQQ